MYANNIILNNIDLVSESSQHYKTILRQAFNIQCGAFIHSKQASICAHTLGLKDPIEIAKCLSSLSGFKTPTSSSAIHKLYYVLYSNIVVSTCVVKEKVIGNEVMFEIWNVATHPAFLRKKYGTFLMRHIFEIADSRGATIVLELNCEDFPTISQENRRKFYTDLGFVLTDTILPLNAANIVMVNVPRILPL